MFFEKYKNGAVRLILAAIFIVLGVAGLFLPFLPGIIFIILGLAMLGNHRAKKLLAKIKEKLKRKKH